MCIIYAVKESEKFSWSCTLIQMLDLWACMFDSWCSVHLQVFQKVSEEKKGKVHVFYCGSPALAKDIKAQCERFGFNFYKENF